MGEWQAWERGTGEVGQQALEAEAQGSDERARTLSLIDFLADYDARRNPPVYDIRKYDLFLLRDADLPEVTGVRLAPAGEVWLTVDFLDLPSRPEVPEELIPLLGEAAAISPHARPEIRLPDDDLGSDNRRSDPERALVRAAEEWITAAWEPFAARWAQVTAAKTLHRDLFQQREYLATDRESLELVWGFGRLRWLRDGIVIDHPLVTIPVEVEQDDDTQRIRVFPAGAPEVEARCLAGLPLADRARYMSIRQSVNDSGMDVWDEQALAHVLQQLIRAVDHEGTLAERAPSPADAAVADGSWALYMRRRLPDYQGFLERMRELYRDESVAVPDTLQAIVTDAPSVLAERGAAEADRDSVDEPLLLPLPTNEEQQRILARAQHSTGVTVQGPPGTGKSHTIANIISHYVAYGKRVLVVAEKEQALRSLTSKIPEGIKDLTVALLGADADSRRELESAIGQIQTRVTAIDRTFADERIRQLTSDLDAVSRQIAATTNALLATRQKDVEHLDGAWAAGEGPTREIAARWLADRAETHGYIDDPVTPAVPPPVTDGELAEFTALIRRVGVRRAEACAAVLPELTPMPMAEDLEGRFRAMDALLASVRSLDGIVRDWGRAVAHGPEGLRRLAATCHAQMEWLAKTAGSWLGQVRDQAEDHLLAQDWASFSNQIWRDREEALQLRAVLTAHEVRIPDVVDPSLVEGLQQARDRMAQAGKLGIFAGSAKRAAQECQVDGRQPTTVEDFDLCLQAVSLANLRRRMITGWHNQLARVGGADLGGVAPEDALGRLLDDLARALAWPRTWAQLRSDLAAAGISSPVAADADSLGQLAEACARACDQISLQELSRSLEGLKDWLHSGATTPGASPLWGLLADALAGRDVQRWQQLRAELADLHEIAPAARKLRELRERLANSAPIWTSRILTDPAAAGNPAEFDRAWQWRQLDTWVRAGLAGPTPAQLQGQLEELSRQRRLVVTELVAERAWRRLADNLGDRQRQALNSYVRAVTRYGKTGGKFAQRWLAEIRAALNESKDAVPVWIMPTAQALASFRPETQAPFDVLVVDEASQIGLEALPLLALAKKTIVVGDDKQTSPENVGLNRQQIFDLLDEHLAAIPKYKTLFDPDNSLYDVAFQKFPGVVMLTEHFRCLPPIIAFSSAHAYNNRIIPLRDQPPRPGWPTLGAVRVADGYRRGMVNEPEADAVVDLVAELCADPEYDGMDMGVISLLGTAQSKLIWDKLYDRLGPEVLRQRRLRSGEAANFQGDERDVIIISTVVAVDPAVPASRVAAMTGNAAMRRINVAASRARQQMWVVHSVDAGTFPEGDLRAALIRHCRDGGATTIPPDDQMACESQFERDVLQKILARGYQKVSVQHRVGQFRIDMVVEGPHTRLAVECDGDRWHGPDVWHRDRARQEVLERAGWTFERIRGSAFYRDPEAALQPLWDRLAELSIPTGEWWATPTQQSVIREVSGQRRESEPQPAGEPAGEAPAEGTPAARVEKPPMPGPATPNVSATEKPPIAGAIGEPASGVNEARQGGGFALAPYRTWLMHTLPPTDTTSTSRVIAGLKEIIVAEGPLHAHSAFRLYVQAAGGVRVGPEIRRFLLAATRQALRAGTFCGIDDGLPLGDEKTLYMPDTPPVLVRELGPRQLSDVPRSEVAVLIDRLGLNDAGPHVIKRSVLDAYGLIRLTGKTSAYLDECLNYTWRPAAGEP